MQKNKNKNKDKTYKIYKHIVEIRHKFRKFNFLDVKGEFLDFLVRETGFDTVKLKEDGTRIDIASEDSSESYFFSFENFGFQLDASKDFDTMRKSATKLFSMIEAFGKYEIKTVSRLGTKSTLICSKYEKTFEDTQAHFSDFIFKDTSRITNALNAEVKDNAIFLDLSSPEGSIHLGLSPVQLDDAIKKFFSGKKDIYQEYEKKHGLLVDMDLYDNVEKSTNLLLLKEQVLKNINALESKTAALLTQFWEVGDEHAR